MMNPDSAPYKIKPIKGFQMCPLCGGSLKYAGISSSHIFPWINAGQMYVCRGRGYKGAFIIEVDNLNEVKRIKEALNSDRADFDLHLVNLKNGCGSGG